MAQVLCAQILTSLAVLHTGHMIVLDPTSCPSPPRPPPGPFPTTPSSLLYIDSSHREANLVRLWNHA